MKSLNAQLRAFKTSVLERADEDLTRALLEAEAEYRADAAAANPLRLGAEAPKFVLNDSERRPHRLTDYLARGPVLVVFFRGGWCPYCTLTLRAYEEIAPDVVRAGGSLLAISPQKATRAALVRELNGVSFPILVDCGNRVAAEYGVLGQAQPMTRQIFDKLGCSIPDENDAGGWMLPRASEFLIDPNGIIRMANVSPVSYERTEPRDALAALRALTKSMAEAHA
ncbi:MAG: AhpC/TSA family protein [Proteobacteria bacterium]|nr:AhpC/TSA family protein [Pseudomonadota bacterium]